MIRHLVDFALRQRTVILICALILTGLGINSFYNVPIEAYPDVADTWVQVITLTFDRIGNFLTASGVCSPGGEVDAAVGRKELGEADVRRCAAG